MRKLYGDSLPTQKEIEANKLANAKRREEEATPPTPSDEGSDASPCSAGKLYAKRDLKGIASLYGKHLMAMTSEGLHSKSDIAAELAWRDFQIQELEKQNVKNNRPHNLT